MRVCVLGACAVDHYVIFNRFPNEDSMVFADEDFYAPGGGGLNVSVNLAIKGADVEFRCSLGEDGFGNALLEYLKGIGVNLKVHRRGRTARTLVLMERGGRRRIVSLGGDALIDSKGDTNTVCDALIILESYPNLAIELFESSKAFRVYSPGGCGLYFGADSIRKVAALADLTFLSETEAAEIPEFESLSDLVIVTRGRSPTLVFSKGKLLEEVPVPAVSEVLDTTGAGDACLSGVVYGVLKGLDLRNSVEIGHEWAEEVIRILGPNLSGFKWREVECRLITSDSLENRDDLQRLC